MTQTKRCRSFKLRHLYKQTQNL